MNDEYINSLISEEIDFSDKLALKFNYPDNITHLLYLIIPAFIIKYGINNKKIIEDTFNSVPIMINDKQDKVYQAYYYSIPKMINNDIVTVKGIVLNNYLNISLIQLIDNLVHEYNHAVNSFKNEINITTDYILIRTGICHNYFSKNDLSFIKKGEEITLEEVINTKQTESIINIIKDFSNHNINNSVVSSTIYSIYHDINNTYISSSYYLESYVCRQIMNNKTFISTFENLRFNGEVNDLYDFFDNITGKNKSFFELCELLNKSLELQHDLSSTKFFKNRKINKIRDISNKALDIVELFNQNTVYK